MIDLQVELELRRLIDMHQTAADSYRDQLADLIRAEAAVSDVETPSGDGQEQTPQRKPDIRRVSHAQVIDMIKNVCAEHNTTLTELHRAWHAGELRDPNLRDLMLVWGSSVGEIDAALEQPAVDGVEEQLREDLRSAMADETDHCVVLNEDPATGDGRDFVLEQIDASRTRLDRLADLILQHRSAVSSGRYAVREHTPVTPIRLDPEDDEQGLSDEEVEAQMRSSLSRHHPPDEVEASMRNFRRRNPKETR